MFQTLDSTNRHRVGKWMRKQKPSLYYIQETHLNFKNWHLLKVKEWINVFQASGKRNQVGIHIQISEKIYIKLKMIIRDEEVTLF